MKKLNIVIVGAGLTSAVIARELVESSDNIFVTVFEKRNHM